MHEIDPKNPVGQSVKTPGIFKHCKAIGWFVEEIWPGPDFHQSYRL